MGPCKKETKNEASRMTERGWREPVEPLRYCLLHLPRRAMSTGSTSGKISIDYKRLGYPSSRPSFCLFKWKSEQFSCKKHGTETGREKKYHSEWGYTFFFFFTNLEIWRLIMLTLLKNISMEIFYQNNQHDRSKCKPKTADILRLLLLAPAGTRKHADPL